jgi:hypothetical protein
MDTFTSILAILAGLFLRLAIPIAGTLMLVSLLRKLDAHWQAEAKLQPVSIEKVECWKIKGCSKEELETCIGAASRLPCWQAYRQPNGYLQEKCISCEVFLNAPIPAPNIEPRRL